MHTYTTHARKHTHTYDVSTYINILHQKLKGIDAHAHKHITDIIP